METRLGRRIDRQLASLGRQLWFDPIHGLNGDNSCGGCHSPTDGFGDTQPIAIGIDNNGIVGPDRTGPRNQRRSPMVINSAFYPTLMWNSRFHALSGDPFDNAQGFAFPAPEGITLSYLPHLLTAQAFIPPTERVEQTGFHFPGDNDDIRGEVVRRTGGAGFSIAGSRD
jgi:cytochrome c peroxidase